MNTKIKKIEMFILVVTHWSERIFEMFSRICKMKQKEEIIFIDNNEKRSLRHLNWF